MNNLRCNFLLLVGFAASVGCIEINALAATKTPDLKMPLKLQLAPPVEGWFYRGRFSQEGDGPLGRGNRSVQADLTIERTASFPAEVTFRMNVNNVVIRHPDHTRTKANPNDVLELVSLAHVKMDQYGHTPGTYNPDEFPLSLISHLWPLPPIPIDEDEDYIEKVESKDQAGPLRFKGTRKIIFHKTRMFKGVLCAILESQTNLDLYYANRQNFPPLQLNIDSHIVFDMEANWPRSVHQDITYAGKARQKDGNLRDLHWQMEWDLHRRKLKPPPPEPEKPPAALLSVSAGEVITPLSVKVGGMRLIRYYDKERGIKPFGRQKGYTLWLVLELPEPDLTLVSGQVHKAVTNTGQNILPQRHIPFPKLSKDKKAAQFDIELSLPDANAKALAEVSGALYALKSSGIRKIDLGLMDFNPGAKSKLQDCSIDSIRTKEWNKGYNYMRLKVNLPRGSVKEVCFYRQDGTKIEVSRGGWSYTLDRIQRMEFKTKGEFPSKGRIVIEVFDNITEHELPFNLTNISLLGEPFIARQVSYNRKAHRKGGNLRDFDSQMEWDIRSTRKLKAPATEPEKPPVSVPSPTAREVIKPLSVKVGGVRLIKYSDKKRGIRPFNHEKGYTLSLILELPEPGIKIIEGQLDKAVTDTRQNILPELKRHTSSPKLSKDKKAVVFDVDLSLPHQGRKGLAEVSGALYGLKSTGTRKIDLGIMNFKPGSKSKIDGFSIKSVKKQLWNKEYTEMELNVSLLRGSVKNVTVYRENGTQVEVHRAGTWSTEDRLLTYGVRTKGEFPPRGRIVFEVLDGITKNQIPFKLTNISLLGQPL